MKKTQLNIPWDAAILTIQTTKENLGLSQGLSKAHVWILGTFGSFRQNLDVFNKQVDNAIDFDTASQQILDKNWVQQLKACRQSDIKLLLRGR